MGATLGTPGLKDDTIGRTVGCDTQSLRHRQAAKVRGGATTLLEALLHVLFPPFPEFDTREWFVFGRVLTGRAKRRPAAALLD